MKTRVWGIVMAAILVANCLFSNGAMITANAAKEDFSITLDGDSSEWDYIKKMVTDTGRFASVAAFYTSDTLYIMRELSDTSDYAQDEMFIDAGQGEPRYQGYIDYMLQGSNLHRAGHKTEWTWGDTTPFQVKFNNDKSVAEYAIPLSSIGNPTGEIKINVGAINSKFGVLSCYPAAHTAVEKVPSFDEAYQEDDSEPISSVTFTPNGALKAITEATMGGGTIGTLSSVGGTGEFTYSFAASAIYGVDNGKFVIDGDKVIVKEGLLSPGSYNIYIKASSGIRTKKQAVSFIVEAAESSTAITESVFSGKKGEWFAVNHVAANSIPTLSEFKAAADGYNLYAYVSAESLSAVTEFYIGTSEAGGADLSDTWKDATSVKYKVDMSGNLYKYEGGWKNNGTVTINKNGVGAEIQVPLASIGNAKDLIYVAVKDGETCYLPNKNRAMHEVTTPIIADTPAITADGDMSDWTAAGLRAIAKGSGTVGDIYALRDNDWLYVMSTIDTTAVDTLSSNLLINADGNSATGYQHSAYEAGSGADFLVQDWFSTGDKRNVEFFFTDKSTWNWAGQGDASDYEDYKVFAQIGDTNKYCIEYKLPISEMKGISTTVSDDFFIAITRDNMDSNDPVPPSGYAPASGSYVAVPKYRTTLSLSATDGSFADWNTVSKSITNSSVDTTCNLYATCSAERLYTLVTNDEGGLNTVNTYYISTIPNRGYTIAGYEGIEYIVRDAKLYKVTGNDKISDEIDDVWMSYYNDNIEMQLYLSQLGSVSKLEIAWRGVDGTYAIPADNTLTNVNAKFDIERSSAYYYPKEDFASFDNPYKGWVRWATMADNVKADKYAYDVKMVYLGIRWSEFEPVKGKYNFDIFEEKFQLSYWLERGVRINLRFLMDNPEEAGEQYGGTRYRKDIPDWLYEELLAEYGESGYEPQNVKKAGTYYFDATGSMGLGEDLAGFSPNYNSQLLVNYHDKAIEALASYFDDTSITSFVQIGSIGHWGEFHTWPANTGVWPGPEQCAEYMKPYTKYFHNVKLGLRKPYPYAAENGFGLFNDIFGVTQWAGTPDFYNYIMNGCTDMNGDPAPTGEQVAASAMPDFWKTNYSGGEFASGEVRAHVTNDTAKDGSKGIIGCMDQVRYTHVSWLGPCSPADLEKSEIAAYTLDANVQALKKLMGYNFALEKIMKRSEIVKGIDTSLVMTWNNQGVAPFYYDWPIEVSLINSRGQIVYKEAVDTNITEWLPGRHEVPISINVPTSVTSGTYTLAIGIAEKSIVKDADGNEQEVIGNPAIRLAIDGGRSDLRYPLYSVAVRSTSESGSSSGGNSGGSSSGGNSGGSSSGGSSSGSTSGSISGSTAGTTTDTTTDTTTTETSTSGSATGTTSGTITDTTTDDATDATTDDETTAEESTDTVTAPSYADIIEVERKEVVIEELTEVLAEAAEGEAFSSDMKEETVVTADVLQNIRDKQANVEFVFSEEVKWYIKGDDVTEKADKDIDLQVIMHTDNIPTEVRETVNNNNDEIQFTIKHEGEFGFKAILSLFVGEEHVGRHAELFWHNTAANAMETQGFYIVDEDGTVKFPFTHASDYMIILSDEVVEEAPEADSDVADTTETIDDVTTEDVQEETPVEEGGNVFWIIIAIIIIALLAAGYFMYKKGLFKEGGKR